MSAAAFSFLQSAIAAAGGWLSFEKYVNIAQHHPRHGYYGSGRFGDDFITAPLLSPLFADSVGEQLAQVLSCCGGDILELGAGDGLLARQLVNHPAVNRYFILETSGALRRRQRQTLRDCPTVEWLEKLPRHFCGVIFGNEVMDSVPFRLVAKRGGQWRERGVVIRDGELCFGEKIIGDDDGDLPFLQKLNTEDDYETEISPQADALTASLIEVLDDGVLLLSDYGFGESEYYHPQRKMGTMMCHYRRRADGEPLLTPGEKDISAHVNFSALAAAAFAAGATVDGYATQANFLINCGILEKLKGYENDAVRYAKLAAGAQKLLAPHEMGELFKFVAFGKGKFSGDDAPSLIGFGDGDMRRRL